MPSVITRISGKAVLVFLLLMLLNCAAEKKYKVLSIFFDGVPKPGTGEKQETSGVKQGQASSDSGAQANAPVMVSKHPDYSSGNCDNCHDRSAANFLKGQRNAICFSCHDSSDFQGKYVHGPVAVNDCMYCHLPHESPYASLLTNNDTALCLSCHLEADVLMNPVHRIKSAVDHSQTISAEQCTECHYAHAAGNRFFLKNTSPPAQE